MSSERRLKICEVLRGSYRSKLAEGPAFIAAGVVLFDAFREPPEPLGQFSAALAVAMGVADLVFAVRYWIRRRHLLREDSVLSVLEE